MELQEFSIAIHTLSLCMSKVKFRVAQLMMLSHPNETDAIGVFQHSA